MRQCPYAKGTAFLKLSIDHLADNLDCPLHPGAVQPGVMQQNVQCMDFLLDVVQDTPVVVSQPFVLLFQTFKFLFIAINVPDIGVEIAADLPSSPA